MFCAGVFDGAPGQWFSLCRRNAVHNFTDINLTVPFNDVEGSASMGVMQKPQALGEVFNLDDVGAHRRPNHTTAPIMTRSAPPMSAIPTMPHIVEVVTATRKDWDADSPRALARTLVT